MTIIAKLCLLSGFLCGTAHAHVPGSSGCEHNCCKPPHADDPDWSQVTYLRDSGGIELDLPVLRPKIDAGDFIDFGVIFAKEYDLSTFQVFVGCGGCASDRSKAVGFGWDVPNASLALLEHSPKDGYQPAKIEPFTQHAYWHILPKEKRKFNASRLRTCESHHFSIRIVTHDNVTETIQWAAVLGCESAECEKFTFEELLKFPIYTHINHRDWNHAGFSLGIVALVVSFLYIFGLYLANRKFKLLCVPVPTAGSLSETDYKDLIPRYKLFHKTKSGKEDKDFFLWKTSFRCTVYAVIVLALLYELFEHLVHFFIALHNVLNSSSGRDDASIGAFYIVLLLKPILPLVIIALIWSAAREVPECAWRKWQHQSGFFLAKAVSCCSGHSQGNLSSNGCGCLCFGDKYDGFGIYSPFWSHGAWSIFEVLLGLYTLFVYGAYAGCGYWTFSFGLLISGLVRLNDYWFPLAGAVATDTPHRAGLLQVPSLVLCGEETEKDDAQGIIKQGNEEGSEEGSERGE